VGIDYDGEFLKDNGTIIGVTLHPYSFTEHGKRDSAPVGRIDIGSFEAKDLVAQSLNTISAIKDGSSSTLSILHYMSNAGNGYDEGNIYDFKTKGGRRTTNMYRGSQLFDGLYICARDAGNYLADAVARMHHISIGATMFMTSSFNSAKNQWKNMPREMLRNPGPPHFGEKKMSAVWQRIGYSW
jgi:hypothetical protein